MLIMHYNINICSSSRRQNWPCLCQKNCISSLGIMSKFDVFISIPQKVVLILWWKLRVFHYIKRRKSLIWSNPFVLWHNTYDLLVQNFKHLKFPYWLKVDLPKDTSKIELIALTTLHSTVSKFLFLLGFKTGMVAVHSISVW